jgi:diadenosine tetraphosphate (Ap4A) HIT family hydrolase
MTASRNRKETLAYRKYLKNLQPGHDCEFCSIGKKDPQFVSQTKYFKVIRNIFPYSMWDDHTVKDHLLILPKEHTDTLSSLPQASKIEYVELISKYESKGYNIYARSPGHASKSVIHQHTHLIKSGNRRKQLVVHSRKPYLRLSI